MLKRAFTQLAAFLLSVNTPMVLADGQPAIIAERAELQLVASGFAFTEGPAPDSAGNVYFTDQPNDRILKWSPGEGVSVFMDGTGRANGLYFDADGRLIACADEHNELWRIAPDKTVEVLLKDVDGQRLNGPNDAWVAPGGGIYFTDPYYQRDWWMHSEPELTAERVYHLTADGTLNVADGELKKPNGIIGSPDGRTLYVADIGAGKTWVYDIELAGGLTNKRLFVAMGSDGMTIDAEGNLYLTGDGVSVFDSGGAQIAHIPVDEAWTSNVTFGGPQRDILFITAMDSVYMLRMAVRGAH